MMRRDAVAAAATAADPGEGRLSVIVLLPDVAGVTEILADMQTRLLLFGITPAASCSPSTVLLVTSSRDFALGLLLPVPLVSCNLESVVPLSGAVPVRDSAEVFLAYCMDGTPLLLCWRRLLPAARSLGALVSFAPGKELGVDAWEAVLAVVEATAAAGVLCPMRCFAAAADLTSGRLAGLEMASCTFSRPSGLPPGFCIRIFAAFG